MLKDKKQFCRWMVKYNSLPAKLRRELEKEFVTKATQYCQRKGLRAGEYVVATIKPDDIQFSFIVVLK